MRHTSRLGSSLRYVFLPVVVLIFSLMLGRTMQGQAPGASSPQSEQRVTSPALPSAWNDGVRALAEKIAAAVKPSRAILLEVQNISSLGAADVGMIRQGLQQQLEQRGIRIESDGLDVKVMLSEDADTYVWVSQIRRSEKQDGAPQVAIVSVARTYPSAFAQKAAPTLQRKVVGERREPILDFAFSSSGSDERYFASVIKEFGPGFLDVASFTFDAAGENRIQLPPLSSVSRDLRGLVAVNKDGEARLFAANDVCVVTGTQPTCGRNSNQEWTFPWGIYGRFVGNRNYFAGFAKDSTERLEGQPFYTAAIGINIFDHSTPIVTTELDGVARLYNGTQAPEAAFGDWGDDIASIKPSCGAGWQILVTGRGDWTESDRIRVYAISFGNNSATAKPEGQPLEFPGPILAMWQADDEKSARVISKNLQTGMYEASIVTVSCSQ
jgi:hypothetical protein